MVLFGFHFVFLFGFFIRRGGSSILLLLEGLYVNFIDLSFYFVVDSFSMGFVSFIMFISSMVFFYRRFYMGRNVYEFRFSFMLLLFVMSMRILVLSPGMLGILLG